MNFSSWKLPELVWQKSADGLIRIGSRWAKVSACAMGISLFVRMMYYFGLVNLRDFSGWDVATRVWIPMVLSAVYLIFLRFIRRNEAIFTGGFLAALAVSYLLTLPATFGGILGGILVVVMAAGFVLLSLGIVPVPNARRLLVSVGVAALTYRVLTVELFGWLLPITQFRPIAYLAEGANLAMLVSMSVICLALRLRPLANPKA